MPSDIPLTDSDVTMPQMIETHVSSQAEKQAAEAVCGAFDAVRDAAASVEDAQINALYERYKWGRQVYDAMASDEVDTGDVYAEVARRLDKSKSYVSHHKRFAERCANEYPGFDPSVAGYVAEAQDKDWRLTWSRAVRWVGGDKSSDNATDPDEELDRLIKDVEHHREKLDETVTELEEKASEGQVPERLQEAAESVTVAAKEEVEDTVQRMSRLPEAAPERVQDKEYLKWLRERHACVACGIEGEGMTAHHLREYVEDAGIATKVDDYKTLPLCPGCHRDLEDMPSLTFWENTAVSDPPALADELAAEFLRLVRTDQL